MGIFSSIFGSNKFIDKVGPNVRQNTELVGTYMKGAHDGIQKFGDFTFEYLYTSSEQITQSGLYGSVIYIRVNSPVHENVALLAVDFKDIQRSIDEHQTKFKVLPDHLSKDVTRWLYFNMGKIFRTC